MKRNQVLLLLLSIALTDGAQAQVNFPVDTAKFAQRATDATDISLNKSMLQLAGKFLSASEEDQEARRIIANLDGVYVRTYTFGRPDAYSAVEIEAVRSLFHAPEWTHIVSTRSKGPDGDTDVYVNTKDDRVKGMFVLSAQPADLTFIHLIGPIKPEDLKDLSGHFGVPLIHDGSHGPKKGRGR